MRDITRREAAPDGRRGTLTDRNVELMVHAPFRVAPAERRRE